ncbi:DUF4157 domain-containing protein [Achromobacter arsenitoxydans]|uniref:eCIS core domain-containing protein n=1 Tax=Achromobacter arsenitoxydans SY8 TaxID=477184 RepID=H0FE16_9BURK|nr:DUF4157 domain-containing protein [Achromobacter arsenitoxydans]EHK63462.1 hypothetical protein KYC_25138 [Achromobacter arsenitoxydans SY8]
MRTFVQDSNAARQASSARGTAGHAASSRNAATPRAKLTRDEDSVAELPALFPLDLGRLPLHPPAATRTATTLAINNPGDTCEQEADRASRHVMRMTTPANGIPADSPGHGQKLVQVRSVAQGGMDAADAAPVVREALTAPGRPLDASTRAFMEPRFGQDFRQVRLHTDAEAVRSANAVQARAYTVGHHVVLGAGEYAPGTSAGRALLAHELAHVVQQSSMTSGSAMLLQREPSGPTYGNLPRDAPAPGSSGDVVRLRKVNDTWKEIGPKYTRTARGNYDFVVKDGEIFAVKTKKTLGGGYGHTEAARGERVNWAGQVEFESGKVKTWNDGSGHYRPLSSMNHPAVKAGLPDDPAIYKQHPETAVRPRPRDKLPQLPVEQPATKPRVPGEPPKVGAGPPRMEEFEARFGKQAATAPAAATAALAEEAGSVLKVSGRTASALGKIGSAAGWVANFLMPGPQDAIMLMVQFAMSYAEAQDAERSKGMRSGFGQGLCAGLLRLNRGWIRDNLAPKVISRSVASHVAATTGYREKGFVQGLVAGISFAERLSAEQRKAMIKETTRAMRAKGDDMTLRARWERGYTANDIIDMSVALAPRVAEILEEAQKNEELRQAAETWRKFKKYGPLMPLAPLFEESGQ